MKRYLSLILCIIMMLSLCSCGDKLPPSDNDNTEITTKQTEPETLSASDSNQLISHPNVLNVMLFGVDSNNISDAIMLVSIDSIHQKIKLTSFMRDTYVEIPDYYSHKLNYSYALGGEELAIQTIEQNYGIKIDRYASVNFFTFRDIIDILGGVEIELTANEIGYINGQLLENGQSSHYLDAQAGVVKLNGTQALWHARNRGGTFGGVTFSGSDWERTERQRNIISTIVRQLKDCSLDDIEDIARAVFPNLTTDFQASEFKEFFTNYDLSFLNYDIEEATTPFDGNWSYDYNEAGSVIIVNDWTKAKENLISFVFE